MMLVLFRGSSFRLFFLSELSQTTLCNFGFEVGFMVIEEELTV